MLNIKEMQKYLVANNKKLQNYDKTI